MAKVKVYELARELNIGSKEIISFLSENNIKVTNHMNNLEDSSIELVKNKYMKKETKTITKPETEMKAKEERQTEKKQAHAAVERPKKKKSITAVFNPQNSKTAKKRPARSSGDRMGKGQGDRNGKSQEEKPVKIQGDKNAKNRVRNPVSHVHRAGYVQKDNRFHVSDRSLFVLRCVSFPHGLCGAV